jgi:hypothetical protein
MFRPLIAIVMLVVATALSGLCLCPRNRASNGALSHEPTKSTARWPGGDSRPPTRTIPGNVVNTGEVRGNS